MIRVNKSGVVPPSLLVPNCNKYNGQDVEQALVNDQHEKCYICEQKTNKDYQIEHFKAKAIGFSPELKYSWSNLLLACSYCNGRKPNVHDLLNPTTNNVEDIVKHHFNSGSKSIVLEATRAGAQEDYTVRLLDIIFNGTNNLRKERTRVLYRDLEREIVFFRQLLVNYKNTGNAKNKQKVIDSLLITKEFLAFKYWIIKDSGFYNDFKPYMLWNRL